MSHAHFYVGVYPAGSRLVQLAVAAWVFSDAQLADLQRGQTGPYVVIDHENHRHVIAPSVSRTQWSQSWPWELVVPYVARINAAMATALNSNRVRLDYIAIFHPNIGATAAKEPTADIEIPL